MAYQEAAGRRFGGFEFFVFCTFDLRRIVHYYMSIVTEDFGLVVCWFIRTLQRFDRYYCLIGLPQLRLPSIHNDAFPKWLQQEIELRG